MNAHLGHRLVAFTVALTFAGLPVATAVCEAACAEHVMVTGGDHRCCHGARPGTGAAFTAIASLCDHPDALPASNAVSQTAVNAPALAEAIAVSDMQPPDATRRAVSNLVSSRHDLPARITQLRI